MKEKETYTVYNPWSGAPIMSNIPSDRIVAMTKYFAWMTSHSVDAMVVKKDPKKSLQLQAN